MSSIPVARAGLGSAINNAISRVGQPLIGALVFIAITATFYDQPGEPDPRARPERAPLFAPTVAPAQCAATGGHPTGARRRDDRRRRPTHSGWPSWSAPASCSSAPWSTGSACARRPPGALLSGPRKSRCRDPWEDEGADRTEGRRRRGPGGWWRRRRAGAGRQAPRCIPARTRRDRGRGCPGCRRTAARPATGLAAGPHDAACGNPVDVGRPAPPRPTLLPADARRHRRRQGLDPSPDLRLQAGRDRDDLPRTSSARRSGRGSRSGSRSMRSAARSISAAGSCSRACATPASSSSPTMASCPIATARSASAGSTGGSTTSGTSITAR